MAEGCDPTMGGDAGGAKRSAILLNAPEGSATRIRFFPKSPAACTPTSSAPAAVLRAAASYRGCAKNEISFGPAPSKSATP